MPILDARGNVQKPKGPRKTKCQFCEEILIEGPDAYGVDFVTCPKCQLKKLLTIGMRPEFQVTTDIVKKANPDPGKTGWGVGMIISQKGLPDTQFVFPEEDLTSWLEQIEKQRNGGNNESLP